LYNYLIVYVLNFFIVNSKAQYIYCSKTTILIPILAGIFWLKGFKPFKFTDEPNV